MSRLKLVYAVLTLAMILARVDSFQAQNHKEVIADSLKKYYDEYEVTGSFALYNEQENKFIFCNKDQYKEEFSPASTFKICNSLIGLETGVIKDANFVIKWDSVQRPNPLWNKDHNLKSAFKNSTVWYYRELARRVGGKRMNYWLKKSKYGNADTSGGLDIFWLKGGLRITPEQQIDFLRRLRNNKLPFSKRSVSIVKDIMIADVTSEYVMRAKTGWADESDRIVGWYVGYVETKGNVYYFANCIQSAHLDHKRFAEARIKIAEQILLALGVLK